MEGPMSKKTKEPSKRGKSQGEHQVREPLLVVTRAYPIRILCCFFRRVKATLDKSPRNKVQ
jgi:hypothetical protein